MKTFILSHQQGNINLNITSTHTKSTDQKGPSNLRLSLKLSKFVNLTKDFQRRHAGCPPG
jgi:hypothetical protein